ncbi:uncharacterized protein MONBRDRAFT_12348 [Monosiga brevicollis MX1]|uniref:Sulfotransferase domain-containing protein n=1 Tax=Monosiga brevicollis TaxID=81824 RepID=A9VC01_MONBE|nr:uncharacterized protein MONBRDRAFT_12348 [Monosiga brevicollis MX1]EDQ84940.1 predicted protein [Monosiga brevicollis MX1]|eukprot:XP_001750281.1 hypothetical protein [Monosiga brevicollis MX1]
MMVQAWIVVALGMLATCCCGEMVMHGFAPFTSSELEMIHAQLADVTPSALLRSPQALGRTDRLGFLRIPKSGSTSVDSTIRVQMGYCANACEPMVDACSSCLYSTNCTPCKLSPRLQACYDCPHIQLDQIDGGFKQINHAYRQSGFEGGHLYLLTVVRDPETRLLSHFFFIRSACRYRHLASPDQLPPGDKSIPLLWLVTLPVAMQDAICDADFEYFLRHHLIVHETYTRFLLSRNSLGPISASECVEAIRVLADRFHLFATTQHLPALRLMMHYLFGRRYEGWSLPFPESNNADYSHARSTRPDEARGVLEHNTTLQTLSRLRNRCDALIFDYALRWSTPYYTEMVPEAEAFLELSLTELRKLHEQNT